MMRFKSGGRGLLVLLAVCALLSLSGCDSGSAGYAPPPATKIGPSSKTGQEATAAPAGTANPPAPKATVAPDGYPQPAAPEATSEPESYPAKAG